jgi:hypothetical protein
MYIIVLYIFTRSKMRFRAKMVKESVMVLHGMLGVLERIGSSMVMYLNEDCVRLSVVTESPDCPRVFSELKQSILFFDYKIESQSSNSILLEIDINLFMRALASGKQAPQCQIKLVKRGSRPFLCFESRVIFPTALHCFVWLVDK